MPKLTGMDAIRKKMTLAHLARELDITRGAVAQWDKVPAERMGDVSRVTGLPFEVLRPDLFKAASRKQPA